MSYQYFLKVDGILGEATAVTHKDEIEVMSVNWGLSNSTVVTMGATGTGKAQFNDLSVAGYFGKAGPKLMLACAKGQHLKLATLSGMVSSGGGKPLDVLRIVFTDVVFSQYNIAGGGDDRPMETLSLSYAKVQVTYQGVSPTGAAVPPVSAGWDLMKNAALAAV
jgi:type VI secretion system secreted protein Hcp